MAHEAQERYSDLVLAKVRSELVLKDGFVFNNDYEGDPTAGAVKIPVRDTEVVVSDYDKANGISSIHTYWTQKGRMFIYELLKADGILPTMEAA